MILSLKETEVAMRYYQFIFSALTAMYLLGFACQLGAEKVMIKNYDASDITGLSVSGRFSRVEIVPSEKGFVEVEVAGAKEVSKRVEVFLKNGMLCIRNAASSSVQRVDKSLNIAIGNAQSNLTIGNKSLSSSLVDPEISVTIYCPEVIDLQAS